MSARSLSLAVLVFMSCLAVPVSSAEAQLANLIPGIRARIRAPGAVAGRLTGTVVTRTADSLSIAMENGVPVKLPLSMLTAVEISRGRSRSLGAMKGALWGGGIGALSGLFSDSGTGSESRGEVFAAGVAGGLITGMIIGSFVKAESWERLELPVRTAVIPTRGGPAAVVSIRF